MLGSALSHCLQPAGSLLPTRACLRLLLAVLAPCFPDHRLLLTLRLSSLLPVTTADDVTVGKSAASKQWRVCAGRDLAVAALRLAPLLPSPAWARVLPRSASPLAVPVEVHSGSLPPARFFLLGGSSMPKASAVAESDGVIRQHEWKQGHFPWPFWYVRRVEREEDANCCLLRVIVRTVSTFAFDGHALDPFSDNYDIYIPVLTNTRSFARGDELTVWWTSELRPPPAKQQSTTWEKQARVELRRQTPRTATK